LVDYLLKWIYNKYDSNPKYNSYVELTLEGFYNAHNN
jgi:hypothetical protein